MVDSLGAMRAFVTAVIAAIEACAVALAGLVVVGIPAGLLWWLVFGLDAEASQVMGAAAATWQLAHLVPMSFDIDAAGAAALGLDPVPLTVVLSLAPLGLTALTVGLAARSGWRAGGHGGRGAWALVGGLLGFGGAAWVLGAQATALHPWPLTFVVLVPAVVYGAAQAVGLLARAVREHHEWWGVFVRSVQQRVRVLGDARSAALPGAVADTWRLAAALAAALIGLGALAFTIAIVLGYVEIVSLGQRLQLDVLGSVLLFLFTLALLPIAYIWGIAWFSGVGFSIGEATSVSPFETQLGPIPALPIFGAIPAPWGSAAVLAPLIVVILAAVVTALFAGRGALGRRTLGATLAIGVIAALLVGLAGAGAAALASGSIGPGRLATTGVHVWVFGGVLAAELAAGALLGVFAGRADARRRAAKRGESFAREALGDPHPIDALAETLPTEPLAETLHVDSWSTVVPVDQSVAGAVPTRAAPTHQVVDDRATHATEELHFTGPVRFTAAPGSERADRRGDAPVRGTPMPPVNPAPVMPDAVPPHTAPHETAQIDAAELAAAFSWEHIADTPTTATTRAADIAAKLGSAPPTTPPAAPHPATDDAPAAPLRSRLPWKRR